MNSRGEQLEKHEIVKAKLMEKLDTDDERKAFNRIWECCSEMSVYVQQNLDGIKPEDIFGKTLDGFIPESFADILMKCNEDKPEEESSLFTDMSNHPWAKEAVEGLYYAGIINGNENGEFMPDKLANRAQSAKIIYMLKEQVKE